MNKNTLLFSVVLLGVFAAFSSVSAQSRIRFARGRTSATVSGSIGGSVGRKFALGAKDGQVLSANVSSKSGCVKFDNGATSTTFTTNSGDNFLRIKNGCGRLTTFSLTVSINYGSN